MCVPRYVCSNSTEQGTSDDENQTGVYGAGNVTHLANKIFKVINIVHFLVRRYHNLHTQYMLCKLKMKLDKLFQQTRF